MTENLYDILEIASTATQTEIRKAYRKLAAQNHPDRNPSPEAQEKFRQVTQAYEVLNDPTRRDLYDRYGDIALNPNFKGFEQSPDSQFGDFSSFFSGFGGSHGTQPYQGSDGYDTHHSQKGKGSWDPTTGSTGGSWQDQPYETFHFGTGRRTHQSTHSQNTSSQSQQDFQQGFNQSFNQGFNSGFNPNEYQRGAQTRRASESAYTPPKRGDDITVEVNVSFVESLKGCSKQVKVARQSRWKRGSNAGVHQELVTIDVPANTESDTEIRIRSKGNYGDGGGDAGDLVVTIVVQAHPYLSKVGCDLYLIVPLTLKEALLGAKVEVPTLDGSLRIQTPPNAYVGQKLRLKNRGLMKKSGGQGDLYLLLRPQIPEGRPDKLMEIAEMLEALYPPQGVRGDFTLE